jgi:4-hydroxy-tetrahydrodipicolinate synthase
MNGFSGVCAAAITPHRREGHEADFSATLDLIDFLVTGGVQGICLLGSTGEFLNIKFSDRIRLVHLGVKRSRVPVLAGVSHSTLDGAVELAGEAIASDAAGLLVMPPYFFRYDQADILEFYTQFASEVPRRVPIFLYNIPMFTTGIAVETARALLSTGRFAGIKDSSGNYDYFAELLAMKRELGFTLLAGSDRIFARARQEGADGVVSGCACALPELLTALDRAILASDTALAARLDSQLQEFIAWIVRFPVPVGVKTAAAERGVKTGPLAVPLPPEKNDILIEFKKWFGAWLPSIPKPEPHRKK